MIPSMKMSLIFLVLLIARDSHGRRVTSFWGPRRVPKPGLELQKHNPNGCVYIIKRNLKPQCGSDGKTYKNDDALRNHNCRTGEKVTVKHYGSCDNPCRLFRRVVFRECSYWQKPFCASNGKTYRSRCIMCEESTKLKIDHMGPCKTNGGQEQNPNGCTHFMTEEYSPRCGSDGKTYTNSGHLRNHNCWTGENVTVKHPGPCGSLRDRQPWWMG